MTDARLVLQKYLPAWGLPDISPFCIKVETYLRMRGLPFTTELGDPRKAPKNKMPVLRHGERTIPDSSAILEHLEATLAEPIDAWLGPQQRAIATAVRGMVEEQLYFVVVYERWKPDSAWATYRPVFVNLAGQLGVPGLLRRFVANQARREMLAQLRGQGIGRHTPEENLAIGKRVLDALDELLQGPFFFGERPSTLDATVFAFLYSIAGAPFEGPLKQHMLEKAKLVAYCDALQARYFTGAAA